MYCLGIETSCDETALALLGKLPGGKIKILAEEISSQADVHSLYGGVVPELASREHLKALPLLFDILLKKSEIAVNDISLIAVTRGPGLKGCLLMGVNFARGLSLPYKIPLIGINHIEAHIFSVLLDNPQLTMPFLALVVSGGHTEIVQVEALGRYKLLARTLDDAAGEAFDKAANLLSIAYPGGAKLAALADSVQTSRFSLPKVMREAEGFSFSGLKTAIALMIEKNKPHLLDNGQVMAEAAFAVQEAIVDAIDYKIKKAVAQCGIRNIAVSGGVSANRALRAKLNSNKECRVFYAKPEHCTDNAAMIAFLGVQRFEMQEKQPQEDLEVLPRWPVETL